MSFLEFVHVAFEVCSVLRVVAGAVRCVAAMAKKLARMLRVRGGITKTGHDDGGGDAAEVTDTLDKKGC